MSEPASGERPAATWPEDRRALTSWALNLAAVIALSVGGYFYSDTSSKLDKVLDLQVEQGKQIAVMASKQEDLKELKQELKLLRAEQAALRAEVTILKGRKN